MQLNDLKALLDSKAHVMTPDLIMIRGDETNPPKTYTMPAIYRPNTLDFLAADTWKVAHIPAQDLTTGSILDFARILLGVEERISDGELIVKLLKTNNTAEETQRRLVEAVFLTARATLAWCSPKGGATAIWLFDDDGEPRAWGDIAPFEILEVSEKLPKRLAFLNRSTMLSGHRDKVQIVHVKPERRHDGEIVGFSTEDDVVIDPDALVVAVFEAEGKEADGWMLVAHDLVSELIDANVDALTTRYGPRRVKAMRNHGLWQTRVVLPKDCGVSPFLKGDMVKTKQGMVRIASSNGAIRAHIATSTDNLKKEIGTTGGVWMIIDEVHDDRAEGRTNRHLMATAYNWALKGRIEAGLAKANDDFLATWSKGEFNAKLAMEAEAQVDGTARSTVNEFKERMRLFQSKVGDITWSNRMMYNDAYQWQAMHRPQVKRTERGDIVRRDTRHFPIPASERYRSLKPLTVAILTGHVHESFTLKDGQWVSTPVGLITNRATSEYMTADLLAGDYDDHGILIHGIAGCDADFYVNADLGWLHVKKGDVITLVFRTPIGICSNGQELALEFFVLKPSSAEAHRLLDLYPGDELPVIDLAKRPHRKDEISYPTPVFTSNKVALPALYTPQAFSMQLSAAITIKAMGGGGVGGRSNIEMVCFQHGIAFPFRAFTETWVDLFTQGVPSQADVMFWTRANQADMTRIAENSMTNPIDAVAFERIAGGFGDEFVALDHAGLFCRLEAAHISEMENCASRAKDMMLKQVEAMRHELRNVVVKPYQGTTRLLNVIDRYATKARRQFGPKLTPAQWSAIGDGAVRSMTEGGFDHAAQKGFVLETLAFLYRNGAQRGFDQVLLQGRLLELTVEVLAELKGIDSESLVAENQERIRCQGVDATPLMVAAALIGADVDFDSPMDHAIGCWRTRHQDVERAKAFRQLGGRSRACSDAHTLTTSNLK